MRDGYVANYEQECTRCGYSPTVDVIKDGKLVHTSDLCGCHFFFNPFAFDPEVWNELTNEEVS